MTFPANHQINDSGHVADHNAYESAFNAMEAAAPGATVGRQVYSRLTDEVILDDFVVPADNGDYGLTLTRALAYATPLGKAVRLRRIYPIATTTYLLSDCVIRGSGPGTGLRAPTDTPVTVLRSSGVSGIVLSDFLIDGGVTGPLGAKNYTRAARLIDSTDITLERITARGAADWAVSFERVTNAVVKDYTYTGGGMGRPGGRDGLHFLDCSDVLVDGAVIHSGDDCIGVTSETVGTQRVRIRNVLGWSEIACLITVGSEGSTSMSATDIAIENVASYQPPGEVTPPRGLVRVLAQNNAVISGVSIDGVQGIADGFHGTYGSAVATATLRDVRVANMSVTSNAQHGLYFARVTGLTMENVQARATTGAFDGINLATCTNVTALSLRSRESSQWGIQLNACTNVDIVSCTAKDCGAGMFASNTGGGLRVVNCTDVNVEGGAFTGAVGVTHTAISHVTNTRFVVSPHTARAGLNVVNARLTQRNVMQEPVAAARFKEASDGTLTVQTSYGCTVTKTGAGLGDYTVTFASTLGGTAPIFFATVGHPSDAIKRVIQQKSSTATVVRFTVTDDVAGTPVHSEYINVLVYDQP